MALLVSFSTLSGSQPVGPDESPVPIVYPNAYARIIAMRLHKENSFITVEWHADEDARQREEPGIHLQEFYIATTDLSGDVYPTAYNHLKTLPDFAGAVDC